MGGILTQLKIANSVKRVAVFRGEIYIELKNQSSNDGFSLKLKRILNKFYTLRMI